MDKFLVAGFKMDGRVDVFGSAEAFAGVRRAVRASVWASHGDWRWQRTLLLAAAVRLHQRAVSRTR